MKITFITIFPEMVQNFCAESLLGKAQASGLISISCINPRDFAAAPHFKVDDIPYGGGAGMVMLAEPLLAAIRKARVITPDAKVILMSPSGAVFSQRKAHEFSGRDLIFVCGRYEGVDQRVIDNEVDEECSVGDFILMGGEAAAFCALEASARLLPQVLGNSKSTAEESFDESGLLEAPCYSRPAALPEGDVPAVLMSGNHKLITEWKLEKRLAKTEGVRADLLIAREHRLIATEHKNNDKV